MNPLTDIQLHELDAAGYAVVRKDSLLSDIDTIDRLRKIKEAAREYRDSECRNPILTLDESMSTKTSKVYRGVPVDVNGPRSKLDALLAQEGEQS